MSTNALVLFLNKRISRKNRPRLATSIKNTMANAK